MKYALHGLHLKEQYNYVPRRKRRVRTYVPSVKSVVPITDKDDDSETPIHNIRFNQETVESEKSPTIADDSDFNDEADIVPYTKG